MPVRIGTRGSKLALAQSEQVCRRLIDLGVEVEISIIRTQGDTQTDLPLHEIGGQGLFVRALDDAILRNEIDLAVHSMKDIPAKRPEGLFTAAVLPRDSPADFLVFEGDISNVRTIGTSSTRRRAQLLRHDPTVEIKSLRGNLDTRIRRLVAGDFDAIVVAEAGIQRLGYTVSGVRLPLNQFIPTPNQGTIAIVSRDDPDLIELLAPLDHSPTHRDVMMERAVMEQVGGGCFTPLGIYCREGRLLVEVLSLDGTRWERIDQSVSDRDEAQWCGTVMRIRGADLIREAYERLQEREER
jgi:hydroxymethylbilane synthase